VVGKKFEEEEEEEDGKNRRSLDREKEKERLPKGDLFSFRREKERTLFFLPFREERAGVSSPK